MSFVYDEFPPLKVKKNEDNSFYIKVDRSLLSMKDHQSEHEIKVTMGDATHLAAT